jgi:hypothetical protein
MISFASNFTTLASSSVTLQPTQTVPTELPTEQGGPSLAAARWGAGLQGSRERRTGALRVWPQSVPDLEPLLWHRRLGTSTSYLCMSWITSLSVSSPHNDTSAVNPIVHSVGFYRRSRPVSFASRRLGD